MPYLDKRYDAVVSVLGNSHFHTPIFEQFERYGGTCVLHDSRLTQIYYNRLGREAFLRMAERILGRDVSDSEIDAWLRDEEGPTQFVEDIVVRSSPLIVHSPEFQQIIETRHGISADVAPFCPSLCFSDDELSISFRGDARQRLGLSPDAFVVSSFGYVDLLRKGAPHCVMALSLLRAWGVSAELHLVGHIDGPDRAILESLSERFEVARWLHLQGGFVDNDTYRNYLLGSDAAIQLRSYGWGQPSAALADAISAGLPCVADSDLARACAAPDYVRVVPRAPSHLLIAETLFEIAKQGPERSWEEERKEYLAKHNFIQYAERLAQILDLA
jgi:glycosyltransferase involved in cell wall biosynthesis